MGWDPKTMSQIPRYGNRYYHARLSCIVAAHPYFNGKIINPLERGLTLTHEDILGLTQDGLRLL